MSVELPTPTVDSILYRGMRDLRELGRDAPGISLNREAMRELGLLGSRGVPNGHEVQVTIYDNGRVLIDLQVDE